jgi:hypothetical protein
MSERAMNASAVRHFTLEEANRTLPLVKMIVRDIVELFPDVQRRRERLDDLLAKARRKPRPGDMHAEELQQMERELEADETRLRGYLQELSDIGAELKDPFVGLIDFPCFVQGRDVSLCWKLGEDDVGHWHEADEGFGGRRPVTELPSDDVVEDLV